MSDLNYLCFENLSNYDGGITLKAHQNYSTYQIEYQIKQDEYC